MSNANPKKESSAQETFNTETEISSQEPNLKGTFVAVMSIGIIIVISWFAVWGLFLSRS